MSTNADRLLHPDRLYSASDIGSRPCPVSASPGLYAFYFKEAPPGIDTRGCHRVDRRALLYVGIAPKPPPRNGRAPSKSHLRQRLRNHYFGNAAVRRCGERSAVCSATNSQSNCVGLGAVAAIPPVSSCWMSG